MRALVSLAHTVFNAGLGVTWETNRAELRFFEPARHLGRAPARGRLRRSRRIACCRTTTRRTTRCCASKARRATSTATESRPGRVCVSRIRRRLLRTGAGRGPARRGRTDDAADSLPPSRGRSLELLTAVRGPAHARPDLPHLSRVVPGAQPGRVRALPVAAARRPAAFPCSPTSVSSGKAMPRSIAR